VGGGDAKSAVPVCLCWHTG